MRRSVAGAFLTLKDGAMKACSFRDPPNERSDEALDDFDTTLIGKSRDRVNLPMFNLVTEQLLGKKPSDSPSNGDQAKS